MTNNTSQLATPVKKNNGSDTFKFWLPILLLPIVAVLLMPREHVGKISLIALGLAVVFGVLVANLRLRNGSPSAKLLEVLALAMPIATIGGCIKYSIMNEFSSYEFVLFNGSGQPMDIVFDGKTIHLQSRQVVEREVFSDKLKITDPISGEVAERAFSAGLSIIAYGKDHALKVTELDYKQLSFSNGGGGSGSSYSQIVHKGMLSMRGDFFIYMPGQDPPRTISRPAFPCQPAITTHSATWCPIPQQWKRAPWFFSPRIRAYCLDIILLWKQELSLRLPHKVAHKKTPPSRSRERSSQKPDFEKS